MMCKRALSLLFILAIAAQYNFAVPSYIQIEPDEEEYLVYQVLLKKEFIGRGTERVIIKGDTIVDNYSDYPDVRKKLISRFKATSEDYLQKNARSYELKDKFNLNEKIIFLKQSEMMELIKEMNRTLNSDEWAKIQNEKYPNSGGIIISLSRVGFNSNKTQALVQVGFQCGVTCGEGNYFLLTKNKGRWKIKKKHITWIA